MRWPCVREAEKKPPPRAGNTIFPGISIAFFFGLVPVVLGFKVCKENLFELLKPAWIIAPFRSPVPSSP
jgi:hypothetical protein